MVLPQYREPQYWDSYLPSPDDYEDAQAYIDALAAGAEDTSPVVGRYWDPIGQQWRGGKTTEREQALVQFGKRDKSYDAGLGGAAARLDSAISVNPDAARLAYGAYDEFGNPLIDPATLAMIEERLGLGPAPVIGDAISGSNPPDMPASGNRDTTITQLPPDFVGGNPTNRPMPDFSGTTATPREQPATGTTPAPPVSPFDPFGPSPVTDPGSGAGPSQPPAPPTSTFDPTGGPPGSDMGSQPLSAVSTIDPRYPDFMLQQASMGARNRLRLPNQKFGGRPLGGY